MNWIVCPTHNLLTYLKPAVASFRAQDIGEVAVWVIDRGSTDGTLEWLNSLSWDVQDGVKLGPWVSHWPDMLSLAATWNRALSQLFNRGEEHVLVANNDIELHFDAYRKLLADPAGFVTCVGVGADQWVKNSKENINPNRRPHPDFSCFLIRRWVWEKVGPFDENYKIAFCEDNNYHCQMHQAGIEAVCLDVPFLHHASMTIKTAPRWRQNEISRQAEANREYFYKKWGFRIGSPEYEEFFQTRA